MARLGYVQVCALNPNPISRDVSGWVRQSEAAEHIPQVSAGPRFPGHVISSELFKDLVITPLWTKAGPAKIVTWAIILALLIASPIWVLIGLVRWVFIPDADRALNLALRAAGNGGKA